MLTAPRAVAWLAAALLTPATAQVAHVQVTEPLRLGGSDSARQGRVRRVHREAATARRGELQSRAAGADRRRSRASKLKRARAAAASSYARQLEQTHDRLLGSLGAASAKIYSYRYSVNGFAARLTAGSGVAARAERRGRAHLARHRPAATDEQQRGLPRLAGSRRRPAGRSAAARRERRRRRHRQRHRTESPVAARHGGSHAARVPQRMVAKPRCSACGSAWVTAAIRRPRSSTIRRSVLRARARRGPASTRAIATTRSSARASTSTASSRGTSSIPARSARRRTSTATARTSRRSSPVTPSTPRCSARASAASAASRRARVSPSTRRVGSSPATLRGTCTTSDLVRAIDDAVADGVDLINYSVGSLETELDAPDDLALLDALDAGVLTVVAAGNDGPELDTIGSPSSAPWVLDDGRLDAGRRVLRRRHRDHGAGRLGRGDRDARGVVHAAA